MIYILIFLFLYAGSDFTFSQHYLISKRAGNYIIIDGILNEASWGDVDSAGEFIQVEPEFGKPAENKTAVKILYNSEFLYIGGTCYTGEKNQEIRVPDFKRDFIFEESDNFGIILDLLNDKRSATAFFITPLGTQRDLMVFDDKIIDENWNTRWYSAAHIYDSGWTFEIAIPWTSIRYSPQTDSIGVNFIRLDRNSNELSAWVPYPRTYSMFRLSYSGSIRGVKFPDTHQDILLTPYVLIQNNSSDNFSGIRSKTVKPGAEMKWALNSNTLMDFTLNTDFAQADADRDVINFSRFDILFPERRQFFLESAGLFETGNSDGIIEPFFSRRIGLDNSGNPVPMDGGARMVHRDPENNYGILAANTHIPDSMNSFFLIGRYSRNYGQQNRIGFLGTYRRDNFNGGTNNNIVSAGDGLIRLNNAFSVNWMLSGSGNLLSAGLNTYGYSQASSLTFLTEGINLFLKEYLISDDYSAGSGFIAARNIASVETGTDLYLRPGWKPEFIRDFEPGLYFNYNRNLNDGRLRQFYITIWPLYILLQSGSVISAKWIPYRENLYEDFTPFKDITFGRGEYYYSRYEFKLASDPSASFYYSIIFSTGSYYDGKLRKLSSQIKYRPIANVSVSVNYEPNWLFDAGISDSDKKIEIISSEIILALNPSVNLTGFYQYNSEDKSSLTNLRFSWEYSPLSYLILLYNVGTYQVTEIKDFNQQQLLLKFSYQFQL